MAKESKSLPEAIKLVIEKHGKIVIGDILFVNIISDLVDLQDDAAVKTVLKDILSMGYGKKLLTLDHENEDFHFKIKAYSKEISSSHGYKNVIVQYVLYSLAYGLGWINQVPRILPKETPKEQLVINNSNSPKIEKPFAIVEKKRIPFWAVALIAIIPIVGVAYAFSYMAASTDREQFNQRIFSGDSFMYNGEYENAVEKYKEAYNGYNALNSDNFKEDAIESMEALNSKVLQEGMNDNKKLFEASNLIKSELQLNLDKKDKDKLLKELDEVETLMRNRTNNGRQQLITNISANNGKLDESGKVLLDELLLLSPDDYWLNFIKKKSYE